MTIVFGGRRLITVTADGNGAFTTTIRADETMALRTHPLTLEGDAGNAVVLRADGRLPVRRRQPRDRHALPR